MPAGRSARQPRSGRAVRVLLISAHPLESSLHGRLRQTILEVLSQRGHEVDDCDLYRENFDPVLDATSRENYFDTAQNTIGVASYVERLFAAEAVILCFPVWCFGPPAILKGFLDRVLVPGVSFRLGSDGRMHPNLRHIRKLIAVTSYGRSRLEAFWMGDPPRKMITRYLRWFIAPDAAVSYVPLYGLHRSAKEDQSAFIQRVAALIRKV
jgi:NAD(P)H dehydrogenase (quinone)